MLYLICTMLSSVDLACYGVSRAKDWVSVDCGISGLDMNANEVRVIKVIIEFIWHPEQRFMLLESTVSAVPLL